MPSTDKRMEFLDYVKKSIVSMMNGISDYRSEYKALDKKSGILMRSMKEYGFVRDTESKPLLAEIKALRDKINEDIEIAVNTQHADTREILIQKSLKYFNSSAEKHTTSEWNEKKYQKQANGLSQLLVSTVQEHFKKNGKASAAQNLFLASVKSAQGSDIVRVVSIINDILNKNTDKKLVALLQKNLAADFNRAHPSFPSHDLKSSPLKFSHLAGHKPQIVLDTKAMNKVNDKVISSFSPERLFEDKGSAPYRMGEAAKEIDKKILLKQLEEKINQYQKVRQQEMDMGERINAVNSFVMQIANNYWTKIQEEVVFAGYFNEMKKTVDMLRDQGSPVKSIDKTLEKAEKLQKLLGQHLVGENDKVMHSLYTKIKELVLGSPHLRDNLGSMVTTVRHGDEIVQGKKLNDQSKLGLLGEDARVYLAKTPKKVNFKFFANEKIKGLQMTVQENIKKFLQTVGLITAETLQDRKFLLNIKDVLNTVELPSDKLKSEFITLQESTARVKIRGQHEGAIYKRNKP